jgi:twitching motility two-component system response regulator PilG
MRLEFDPAMAVPPPVMPAILNADDTSASANFITILKKGIAAATNGERENARQLLMQATEINSLSEDAWMWLASISDYPEELVAFLNNVLTVNPENERAKKWLAETESLIAKSTGHANEFENDLDTVEAVSVFESMPAVRRPANFANCPFCADENDAGVYQCKTCRATLSLSDIESFFSNAHVDRALIHEALAEMASEWNLDDLNEKELMAVGLGYLNVQKFDEGLIYFRELLDRDPNNVILAGQLNTLAIRIDETLRQNEINGSKPKGKTILVVDDSATVRKLLTSKLEKSGHNVVCAVDGVEGLEMIGACRPDLVFLDITMPRKDGYEVCKEIRSNPESKDLPIVMISGKDGFFDKVRGKMAGASGYVTKPFGPEMLMKTLETHLPALESTVEQ